MAATPFQAFIMVRTITLLTESWDQGFHQRTDAATLPDSAPAPAQTAARHSEFYLQDKMTVFRVRGP